MNLTQAVAVLIKTIRGKRTQRQFSEDSGVDRSVISLLENGKRPVRLSHLEAVMAAEGWDVVTLCWRLAEAARASEGEATRSG